MVLKYFEEGQTVKVYDYMSGYICDDAEEVAEAMAEDDYLYVKVEILEDQHLVIIYSENDE